MKKFAYGLTLLLLVGLCVLPSIATSTLDFSLNPTTTKGAVSYAGGATPLKGTHIPLGSVMGVNTPSHNGTVVNIIGGTLNFTTGNFTGTGGPPNPTWNFGSGGTITLSGCADTDADGGLCDGSDVSGILAIGNFTGTPSVTNFGGGFKIAGGVGLDLKNPALAAFFGLPGGLGNPYTFGLNYSFVAPGSPPSAFSSTVGLSGDFSNNISEPSSLALLGAGLLGVGCLVRRKLMAR
jgi:hypothetical protein